MRIAIYGRNVSDKIIPSLELLLNEIEKVDGTYMIFESYYNQLKQKSSKKIKSAVFGNITTVNGYAHIIFNEWQK